MRGDSCFKGREFESWHRILDGYFFTYLFVVKFEMTKINEKEAGLAHLKKSFRRSSDWNFRLSGNVENVFWPILVVVASELFSFSWLPSCRWSSTSCSLAFLSGSASFLFSACFVWKKVFSGNQCDQIGIFLKSLGHKYTCKISPNVCRLFELFGNGPF